MEPPPPSVEARKENSQNGEAVHQASDTRPSGVADAQTTPDEPINQATSSKAIGSSGGDHDKKLADSTVEEENADV